MLAMYRAGSQKVLCNKFGGKMFGHNVKIHGRYGIYKIRTHFENFANDTRQYTCMRSCFVFMLSTCRFNGNCSFISATN